MSLVRLILTSTFLIRSRKKETLGILEHEHIQNLCAASLRETLVFTYIHADFPPFFPPHVTFFNNKELSVSVNYKYMNKYPQIL